MKSNDRVCWVTYYFSVHPESCNFTLLNNNIDKVVKLYWSFTGSCYLGTEDVLGALAHEEDADIHNFTDYMF